MDVFIGIFSNVYLYLYYWFPLGIITFDHPKDRGIHLELREIHGVGILRKNFFFGKYLNIVNFDYEKKSKTFTLSISK